MHVRVIVSAARVFVGVSNHVYLPSAAVVSVTTATNVTSIIIHAVLDLCAGRGLTLEAVRPHLAGFLFAVFFLGVFLNNCQEKAVERDVVAEFMKRTAS